MYIYIYTHNLYYTAEGPSRRDSSAAVQTPPRGSNLIRVPQICMYHKLIQLIYNYRKYIYNYRKYNSYIITVNTKYTTDIHYHK